MHELKCGVPQGGIFSPFLFNLYLATMPKAKGAVNHIQYADDFFMYAMDEQAEEATRLLQAHVDKVNDWCFDYGLSLNPEKSCARYFYKYRKKPPSDLRIYLGTKGIPMNAMFNYLGINLDRKLDYGLVITEIG